MNTFEKSPQFQTETTQEQERRYKDPHFVRHWNLIDTESALESINDPETLKDLKQLIWYQRLEAAKALDSDKKTTFSKAQEIEKIKSEMKRGWPSFEAGVTNDRIFEYVYSAGNAEDLNLLRDLGWFLNLAVKDTNMLLLPDEYIYHVVSDNNLEPQKLREIYELFGKDFGKVVTILTAIDQKIIKIEDINRDTNLEELSVAIKAKLPGFKNNLE